jgi:mono/diheme cytochrome c family protein
VIAGLLSLQGCSKPAAARRLPPKQRSAPNTVAAASQVDAGRYLVKIGGCNDCHTPGFAS